MNVIPLRSLLDIPNLILHGLHRLLSAFNCFRLHPFPMLAHQLHEPVHGFGFGDVEFYRRLADVEVYFPGRAADVAEIRVGHFSGTIHNATHDGDLHALEMLRPLFDARGDGLEIEQRPAARWTGNVIGFETATTRGLQNVIRQPKRLTRTRLTSNQNRVADAVREQRADDNRGAEQSELWFEWPDVPLTRLRHPLPIGWGEGRGEG